MKTIQQGQVQPFWGCAWPSRGRFAKNSEENLEKDSPHVLFEFTWYEGLHCICPEIVVQLVNMEKGLVRFPTIACLTKTCPTDSEFHSGALVSVATVAVDCFIEGVS
jgi:hypothetical protein